VKASAVSWRWRALCLSPRLWKALYLRAGWKVTDTPASRISGHPLCGRRSRQVMLERVSQDGDVPWHFLFRQTTRLKEIGTLAASSISSFRIRIMQKKATPGLCMLSSSVAGNW